MSSTPSAPTTARHVRWEDVRREQVTPLLARRLVTSERMMLAQVFLDKGSVVPRHSHENEQITWIVEGALHFTLGEDGAEEVIVRAGEVLVIPSNLPHAAVALEDTLDVDIFCPPRADWLDGTDTYFQRAPEAQAGGPASGATAPAATDATSTER